MENTPITFERSDSKVKMLYFFNENEYEDYSYGGYMSEYTKGQLHLYYLPSK